MTTFTEINPEPKVVQAAQAFSRNKAEQQALILKMTKHWHVHVDAIIGGIAA